MNGKQDYKKEKHLYFPPTEPSIIDVPSFSFISLSGAGNPNGQEFSQRVEALYSLSYAVKMSYKSSNVPPGYYEYTVFPLEGIWDLVDKTLPSTNKDNYQYRIMIRQPDFLTAELFARFVEQTQRKKPNPYLEQALFVEMADGLSCQLMHLGSYDDEPQSFAKMEAYCTANGYTRSSKAHREIYLSDPRKTVQERMKTLLRYAVSKN